MYVKAHFYNIQCDCCKALANEDFWRVDEEGAKEDADESGWYTLGGKHYCPNCVKIDDDDNIITADGKVWNEERAREEMQEAKLVVNPYAVKHAFLKCGREGKVINEMYGNEFDSIISNRIKYLTFLKKVELDNRFDELNEILNRYGKGLRKTIERAKEWAYRYPMTPDGYLTESDMRAVATNSYIQGTTEQKAIDEPCPTVCTQSRLGVVKARFLMKNFSGDDKSKCISIEKPAGTITCKDHHSFVTVYNGKGNNVSIDEPAPTITTKDRLGLVNVAHFMTSRYEQGTPASIEQPCGTVTANPKQNLVSTYLMNPQYGWPMYETDRPSPTIIARQDKRPMYAVFTKNGPSYLEISDRDSETMRAMKKFCLENGIADIKMRMLRIDELLSIMGFPKDYALLGTKSENKKYIGNAVECGMARQLCEALYAACAI